MAITLGDITQELNERVLAPAREEATAIINSAKTEASAVLEQARAEALKLVQDAKSEAEKAKAQMRVDMEGAARNFIIMVQEKLEAAVVLPIVDEQIRGVLDDIDFLKSVIEKLVTEFAKGANKDKSIEILLPMETRDEMAQWFLGKFREKMANNLTVHFSDKVTFGFHLSTKDSKGAYFNFDTGLVEVFANFCLPRFRASFLRTEE